MRIDQSHDGLEIAAVSRTAAVALAWGDGLPGLRDGRGWALVSISDAGQEPPDFPPCSPDSPSQSGLVGVLCLDFDDIEVDDDGLNGRAMSRADAAEIAGFVDGLPDSLGAIVVHCGAGVSRSAGVAGALLLALTGDDSDIFGDGGKCPNMTCYRRTLDALGLSLFPDELEERESVNDAAYWEMHADDLG